jgi:2-furoyl-CoA dehydrogenase 2Fe-2S iron sulfur subunit
VLRIEAGERVRVSLTVNARARSGFAVPRTLLSDFLRHELGLYGTHVGCEHGVCGACTVLIDGRAERSCMTFAVQAEGAEIVTVEGLAEGDRLNDLQQAFARHGALQCGYCTPGVLASCTEFLRDTPDPTEAEVRDMLSGHICRCTGYHGMVNAVLEVASSPRKGGSER